MTDTPDEPDFLDGVPLDAIPANGLLPGTVGSEAALMVRGADGISVIGAKCTHLGAPMAKGLVAGDVIHCPWHHACFDLRSGRATKAPAFDPLPVWPVSVTDGIARVTSKTPRPSSPDGKSGAAGPFLILGGGAAGYAAAVALKRAAPGAEVIVLSDDAHAPYDRTLLTKDYLDGKFGEDHLPISTTRLEGLGVDLRLGVTVERIDRDRRRVILPGGEEQPYAKLLIATGAEPKRLDVPGADQDHVTTLRSLADCRRVLAGLGIAKTIAILGSSFIGLEAAASLRSRGLDVTVVSPDERPLAKPFGDEIADAILKVHRGKGVAFRLGRKAVTIGPDTVTLDDGEVVAADLVIVGIGVSPRTALAEAAGLAVSDGITVDAALRTSDPNVFAAGDVANWPDARHGRIRVEHWVVAERQGEVAAANMLGSDEPFRDAPFFWTKHFDFSVRYVGHAGHDAEVRVEGDVAGKDAMVSFLERGRLSAVATVGRDLAALKVQREING